MGVLSHTDITWPNSTRALELALKFYRDEKVDRVVFIGEPTKNGYPDQRKVFRNLWQKVFARSDTPRMEIVQESFDCAGVKFVANGRLALTDLLCVHPANGKRINVGSMRGVEISDYFMKYPGSQHAKAKSSAQGVLVVRYDDSMIIRRLDFTGKAAEDVGPAWKVGADGMIVSEAKLRPRFWEDTEIAVLPGYDLSGNKVLTIRWPSVLSRHTGARAFSYEVEIVNQRGVKKVYRVQSRGFYLPESRDLEAVSLPVTYDGVNSGEVSITPISSLGLRGDPIKKRFSL